MKYHRLALLCATLLVAPAALAECLVGPQAPSSTLTEAELKRRAEIFLALCRSSPDGLVDTHDASLQARLTLPSGLVAPSAWTNCYPMDAKGHRVEGNGVLGLELDASGNVTRVAIISSSGLETLDAAVRACASQLRFKKPATLDGVPRRAYWSYPFGSRMNE